MIDRKNIRLQEQVERSVAPGAQIPNEGVILVESIVNGLSCVSIQATVSGSEKISGVAILPYMLPSQTTSNEQFVVPSSGSLIFNLRNSNLVAGQMRAIVPGASDLTINTSNFSTPPSTGAVNVDLVGGRLMFAAGNAGATVNFLYSYQLTVTQARQRFYERSINNRDLVGDLGLVGVGKGYCEFATDQFDLTKDYTQGSALTLGNNGIITIGGPGPVIPQAKVLATPDLSNTVQGPMLRISMLVG
jgi:hypothetical protein